jgi:probable rRNA maturation factor
MDRRALLAAIATLDTDFNSSAGPASRPGPRNPNRVRPTAPPAGELSIVFLTDQALAQLHAQVLADPSTTDVITFEGDPTLGVAGEICVSVDTAVAYAKTNRRDFSRELLLYVVHGWLHLAGYDDLQPALKRAMRRAEKRALALLAKTNLPEIFSLKAPATR